MPTPDRGKPTHSVPSALPPPRWTATGEQRQLASPRVLDVSGDGVGDVILGHGWEPGEDPLQTEGSITAHDGSTGELLWRTPADQSVFGAATALQRPDQALPDLLLAGRNAELRALEAASGRTRWELDPNGDAREQGWYNTYPPRPVGDLDGDAVPDLLLATGGDGSAAPSAPRPAGRLALLSGATGVPLATAPTPDRAETYMAPLWLPETEELVFGTGGETLPGALWRATLAELLAGDLDRAIPLWSGTKGAMAPPVRVDLDADCVQDLVLAAFDGSLGAISGATDSLLWEQRIPGSETYTSPALGYFDIDAIPDVAISFSYGTWPSYHGATHRVYRGGDGSLLWSADAGIRGASSHLAVDLDGDGGDELLLAYNRRIDGVERGQLEVVWPDRGERLRWEPLPATLIASPWVGDLEGDGELDLLLAVGSLVGEPWWQLSAHPLGLPTPAAIRWGQYYGPAADMSWPMPEPGPR